MDLKTRNLLDYLSESILHHDVSGMELLEILDIRSQLASREPIMEDHEKARLEKFDRQLLKLADYLVRRIAEVADLAEMRKRAHVLPSHWWWYLDQLNLSRQKAVAG